MAENEDAEQLARDAGLAVLELREQIDTLRRAVVSTARHEGSVDVMPAIEAGFQRLHQRFDRLEQRIEEHHREMARRLDLILDRLPS